MALVVRAPIGKIKKPLYLPIPTWLSPFYDKYVSECRHVIVAVAGEKRLFPYSVGTIRELIVELTTALIGRPIKPHVFRSAIVTAVQASEGPALSLSLSLFRSLLSLSLNSVSHWL